MREPVHYFAFGANMARRVLVERRGIVPLASRAAAVRGYELRFGLRGLPGIEPSFATIVANPEATVHGVLHTLAPRDLLRLDRIERSYERIPVAAETADGPFEATAYHVRRPSPERPPSRRYLALLVEGAREHGLPPAYLEALAARADHHVPIVSGIVSATVELAEFVSRTLRR